MISNKIYERLKTMGPGHDSGSQGEEKADQRIEVTRVKHHFLENLTLSDNPDRFIYVLHCIGSKNPD